MKIDDLVLDETEVEKAKRLVAEERAQRERACVAEVKEALDPILARHRCQLMPTMVLHRGAVRSVKIEAVAVD